MRDILYSKYNRTRNKLFQTRILIIDEDGKTYVEKSALSEDANQHINDIVSNYEKYKDMYTDVVMINSIKKGNSVCLDYIKGESLNDIICKTIDDTDEVFNQINKYNNIVQSVKAEYKTDFKVTEAFTNLFGSINRIDSYKGNAVKISNIDSTFDNYIVHENKIYSIDYEWMVEVIVPCDFMKYRTVKMFYISSYNNLSRMYSMNNFFVKCGFNDEEIRMFEDMDEAFQQYVHGKDRVDIYTNRYLKHVTTLNDMVSNEQFRSALSLKENHIHNLEGMLEVDKQEFEKKLLESENRVNEFISATEELNNIITDQQETISVLRRERRNPFYALYRLCRKAAYRLLPHRVLHGLQILRNEGFATCVYKVRQKQTESNSYEQWITRIENNMAKQYDFAEPLEYQPLISVIVPVYNVAEVFLTECIDSVVNQKYTNWQLCLADDCSTDPGVKKVLSRYENNPKIDIVYRTENGHISRATNSALEKAKGEFIAFLDCDDVLTENALYEMVKLLNKNSELDYIYSDEDKFDDDGKNRNTPHFKPDWSPDTLMSNMYTCHLSMYRKSISDEIGGLRAGYEGSQDYDFALRFTEKIPASHIAHIPMILYHWRTRKESTALDAGAKPYILEAALKAKKDAVERRGLKANIELVDTVWQYRVNYIPQGRPIVSIIIPSKDNPEIFKQCVVSIIDKTKYRYYEIICVDNGSSDENKKQYIELCSKLGIRYHYQKMEFNFSRMCNMGASLSGGEYLLFLNDDIEVIDGEWMSRMLGQAQVDYAGAVGAKLLYPNSNIIQHDGVINIKNGPTHAFEGFDDTDIYYFARNRIDFNYIAVTAACLMVNKDKFDQVKGFNEDLCVAYNDVEMCFKLVEEGYYNVVRNDVILYHHESYSRGDDSVNKNKMKRLIKERDMLYTLHPQFTNNGNGDPFYNKNLVQNQNNFSYNYEESIQQYNSYRVKNLSDYSESNEINYSIDLFDNDGGLTVVGWAYLDNKKYNNVKKAKILVIDEDLVYEIDTTKNYRPDVCSVLQKRKMSMIGFECITKIKELTEDKKYKYAVAFGSKYSYFED